MEKATPFVNSSLLPNYRGRVVRIVGKVQNLSGEKLYIQSSDMGSVVVELNRDTELSGAKFVEVIGKVADSGETLREFTSTDLGAQGVDMNLVERAVDISTKFPKIFGGSADGDDDML